MNNLIQLLDKHSMSNKQTYIKTILLSQRIQCMINQLKCQNEATSPTETVIAFEDQLKGNGDSQNDKKPLPVSPSIYMTSAFDSAIDINSDPVRNKPLPSIHHSKIKHTTIIHVKKVYN